MFFKKAVSKEPEAHSSVSVVRPDEAALDAAVALMQTYGRYAVDTDEVTSHDVRSSCEEWVSRILIGESSSDGAVVRRDWGGLRHFFERTRSAESDFFVRSQSSLREALQQFAACLAHALAADRKADGTLEQELESLASTLQSNDPEFIRNHADKVVRAARLTIMERRQREMRHVETLATKFNQLRAELLEARTQATTDGLTQLYNRTALDQHLERITDWGILFHQSPALLFIDVDHFKPINDTYGHLGGDQVLRGLSDVLTRCFLRRQDFVARYGGEEFAVVVVDTPMETLRSMAQRLLEAVRKMECPLAPTPPEVTISMGIAQLRPAERPVSWIERADRALYEAKQAGRDRLIVAQ